MKSNRTFDILLDLGSDTNSQDQKSKNDERKNFKSNMQTERKKSEALDTNLTKDQQKTIQKMFDRRMSIVVKK